MGIRRTNVPFDPRISLPIPRATGYDPYPKCSGSAAVLPQIKFNR